MLVGPKLQCYTLATGWGIEFNLNALRISYTTIYVFVQFQAGGDSKTGVAVSAQEAQAQAILQQTQVHTAPSVRPTLSHINCRGTQILYKTPEVSVNFASPLVNRWP